MEGQKGGEGRGRREGQKGGAEGRSRRVKGGSREREEGVRMASTTTSLFITNIRMYTRIHYSSTYKHDPVTPPTPPHTHGVSGVHLTFSLLSDTTTRKLVGLASAFGGDSTLVRLPPR